MAYNCTWKQTRINHLENIQHFYRAKNHRHMYVAIFDSYFARIKAGVAANIKQFLFASIMNAFVSLPLLL